VLVVFPIENLFLSYYLITCKCREQQELERYFRLS